MNQTANYQLSQWEMEDRLLMQDFNGDNAKVDAALKAQADALTQERKERQDGDKQLTQSLNTLRQESTTHLLKTFSLSSKVHEWNLPIADISWEEWKTVYIQLAIIIDQQEWMQISFDGRSLPLFHCSTNSDQGVRQTLIGFPLFSPKNPFNPILVGFSGNDGICTRFETRFENLSSISISSTTTYIDKVWVLPGSKITIWADK